MSEANSPAPPPAAGEPPSEPSPPLFLIRGDASPEQVAALTVVLQGLAAAGRPAAAAARSEWSASYRRVGARPPVGPAGWRSSALPR